MRNNDFDIARIVSGPEFDGLDNIIQDCIAEILRVYSKAQVFFSYFGWWYKPTLLAESVIHWSSPLLSTLCTTVWFSDGLTNDERVTNSLLRRLENGQFKMVALSFSPLADIVALSKNAILWDVRIHLLVLPRNTRFADSDMWLQLSGRGQGDILTDKRTRCRECSLV